jgi:4-hydroxy-tetrahydrodipicolinate synthase
MVTPFTEDNKVDYTSLERAIDWYVDKQVDGLFAVCQSSEMFYLSLEERVKIASFVVDKARGRVPVIASGHISDSFEEQAEELNGMAGTGIDALVLITNRLANENESDEVWIHNLEKLLERLPQDMALGLYECPYPYKRIVTPQQLKWCSDTGRFLFLKDTSCDVDNIKAKLDAVQGSDLKIYNANSATLLETMKLGVKGYSGIMANFHPELYVWLMRNGLERPEEAELLISNLSITSFIEKQLYPVNAKYYLMMEKVYGNYNTRSKDHRELTATNKLEIEQLRHMSQALAKQYSL